MDGLIFIFIFWNHKTGAAQAVENVVAETGKNLQRLKELQRFLLFWITVWI